MINAAGFKSTVGSVSLKWSCKTGPGCAGDYWGNTNQTFRSIHYYDWMATGGNQFDPFSTRPEVWGLNPGQVLISSSPSWNVTTVKYGEINLDQQFYLAYRNDWMGLLPWSDQHPGTTYHFIQEALACAPTFTECQHGLNVTDEPLPAYKPVAPAANPIVNNLPFFQN